MNVFAVNYNQKSRLCTCVYVCTLILKEYIQYIQFKRFKEKP